MSLLDLCKAAVASAAEETEVWVRKDRKGCARFSLSELSQPMDLDTIEARVRVARGTRVAEVVTNDLDDLCAAVERASKLAKVAPEVEGFEGFAGPEAQSITSREPKEIAADLRADRVAAIIARIEKEGFSSAGMLETETHALAIATSRGAARSHQDGSAELRVWALEDAAGRGASGHGSQLVRRFEDLDPERETEAAIRAAHDGKNPGRVEAGAWDIVMEPVAVAELLEWLGTIAFSAPEVEAGTSSFANHIGDVITGDHISITESAHVDALADPFDREATTRRAVDLIRNGRVVEPLTDRVFGKKRGSPSTGSAIPTALFSPGGIAGVSLALEGGARAAAKSSAELIAGMERGLYVRRLHYVNGFLDPHRAVMTGMSRDGCFLVEKGRVVRAVGNVRFTDSFLAMLARSDAMTIDRTSIRSSWTTGGTLDVPAVRFRNVILTSGSR